MFPLEQREYRQQVRCPEFVPFMYLNKSLQRQRKSLLFKKKPHGSLHWDSNIPILRAPLYIYLCQARTAAASPAWTARWSGRATRWRWAGTPSATSAAAATPAGRSDSDVFYTFGWESSVSWGWCKCGKWWQELEKVRSWKYMLVKMFNAIFAIFSLEENAIVCGKANKSKDKVWEINTCCKCTIST